MKGKKRMNNIEKFFGNVKESNISYVQYGNCSKWYAEQECLMDNNIDIQKHLRSNKGKQSANKAVFEFIFIFKVRKNKEKFLVVRYNSMGLFCELLSPNTEIDIDVKVNDKIFDSVPSSVNKVLKTYGKYRNNPEMKLSEFNKAVKMLIHSYFSGKELDNIDNAHIFEVIKRLQSDQNNSFYYSLNIKK